MRNEFSIYWKESTRPLASLVFLAPFLIFYELGIWRLGPQAMRNGAELWLLDFLALLGLGRYLLLPLMCLFWLLSCHHLSRERWRVTGDVIVGMLLESLVIGFLLIALFQLQCRAALMLGPGTAGSPAVTAATGSGIYRAFGFIGAGIYEELLFRVLLIPAIAGLLRALGEAPRVATLVACLVSSLFFAAAHYELFVGQGDMFLWFTFMYRFFAGLVFCAVYLQRGFGITAGAHTLYDLLVGVLLT